MISEAFPPTLPMSSVLLNVIFWGTLYIIYCNRTKSRGIAGLWRIISMFFIVLLATLGANYAKKSIKAWWSKD
jgi:hypothetical protein